VRIDSRQEPWIARGRRYGTGLFLLVFGAIFALFFTQGDLVMYRAGWLPVRPTLACLLIFGILGTVGFLRDLLKGLGRTLWSLRQNALILLPLLLLAALNLIFGLWPEAYWGEGGRAILYPLYNLLLFIASMMLALRGPVRRHFRLLVAGAFALLLLTSLLDLVFSGFFAKQGARAAGLAVDSNTSAFLMLVACCLLLDLGRGWRYNAIPLALTGFGVLLTLSRGGFLLYILLMASVAVYPLISRRGRLSSALRVAGFGLVILLLAVVLVSLLARYNLGMFERYSAQRRVEVFTSGRLVGPSEDRIVLALEYLDHIAEAPLLGHGSGYSDSLPKGAHNRFLTEWVNLGLPGLLAYLALLGGALYLFHLRGCTSGVLLVILVAGFSVFSHLILESRGLVIVLGMLAEISTPPPEGAGAEPGARGGG